MVWFHIFNPGAAQLGLGRRAATPWRPLRSSYFVTDFNMRLDLGEPLGSIVKSKFISARNNGSLIFSSTKLAIIRVAGVSYQLRYCPALSKKAEWQKPVGSNAIKTLPGASTPRIDPFINPPEDLLIGEIPITRPSHLLVLNKYPVIPNHFIIATKEFKDQRQLLEQDDLAATMACLRAWEGESSTQQTRLFAFFNSGRHSGASQAHRHIQFLPVEDIRGDDTDGQWNLKLDSLSDESAPSMGFPFLHFVTQLSPTLTSADVYTLYMRLYKQAASAVKTYQTHRLSREDEVVVEESKQEGWSEISYNLAMTTSAMAICPRRREDAYIEMGVDDEQQNRIGPASLNGTILAGTLMVKTQREWDALREDDGSVLARMLETVGFPSTDDS